MKTSQTEKTLLKLIDHADTAIEKVNKNTVKLFYRLHKAAIKMDYSSIEEYKDIITTIKQSGEVYDSATFIHDEILAYDESKILEIRLTNKSRDIADLNTLIQSSLNNFNLKNQSYIYIAWKLRPEEYFYVGKAKTSSRTNLSNHGKLLESLKQASYFSMIFPHKPTKNTISNLEAALINLIKYKTSDLPKYNSRKESFLINELDCKDEQENIAWLFNQLSSQFER